MSIVTKFLQSVLDVLPTSPFADFIDQLSDLPYLGYINYFIPVGTFIDIGLAWLAAIGVFYLYSIVMRWINLIS